MSGPGPGPHSDIQIFRNDFYRIASLNCNSFAAITRQQRYLETFTEKGLGVLCLQETHHTPTSNPSLPGYFTLASKAFAPFQGRGVSILARTDLLRRHGLRLELILDLASTNFQLLAARLGQMIIISAYVYAGLTTSDARTAHTKLIRAIESLMDSHSRSSFIVGGDFNYAPLHGDLHFNFGALGLAALLDPDTPTRRQGNSSGTALDNIFFEPSLRLDPGYTRPSASDHLFVIGSLLSLKKTAPRPTGPPLPLPIAFNKLNRSPKADARTVAEYDKLLAKVRDKVAQIPQPNTLATYQTDLLEAARSTLQTVNRRTKPLAPWMQLPSVKRAWDRVNHARNLYWHSKSKAHRKALGRARRILKAVSRAAKRELYVSFLRKLDIGSLDLFYQTRRARIRPLSTADGGPLQTDEAVNFWSEIFRRQPGDVDIATMEPLTTDFSDIAITSDVVLKAIRATEPRSSGPDGLDVRFIKACADIIAPHLADLFLRALSDGMPATLQQGRSVLIPKSNPCDSPAKSRPITVLPVLTRLLHKVMDILIRRWITQNKPFSPAQAGFQTGRSPLEHAATLRALAFLQLCLRETLYAAFLDIEKAFDMIPHARLLHVLRYTIGLPLAFVEAIRRLLIGYSTTIFGHRVQISRGCLQGSPLSPLLCLCYLEDLVQFLLRRGPPANLPKPFTTETDSWILLVLLLFCDDIGLLAISIEQLQWLLNGVRDWTAISGLRISPKSKAMALGKCPLSGSLSPLDIGLAEPLPWVNEFRYLGVTFFSAAVTSSRHRRAPPTPLDTQSLRYQLFLMADALKSPDTVHLAHARVYAHGIHTLVLSRALYPSPIIDIDTRRLDILINKFARRYFRLPLDTSTVFLRTELDILPGTYHMWLRRLRYAPHFLQGPYFRTFIQPYVDNHQLRDSTYILRSFGWLDQALTDAGFTLSAFQAKMAEPTFSMVAWRRESKHIVYSRLAADWPNIFPSSVSHTALAVTTHLVKVCYRRHLPTELMDLHSITGRLPFGLPLYIQLGGLFAAIGLRFKSYSLRPALATGQAAHGRASCHWCGHDGECGIHLLTCDRAPPSAVLRRDKILLTIFSEATQAPAGSRLLRSHTPTILTYTYRLEWPHMTQPTLIFVLKELGRLLNEYRNDLPRTSTGRKAFSRIEIPP